MGAIPGDGVDRFLAYAESNQRKLSSNNKAGIKVLYNFSEEKRRNSLISSISHYFGLKLGKIIDVNINGTMYTLGRKSVEEFLKRNVGSAKRKVSFSDQEVVAHLQKFLSRKDIQRAGLLYQNNSVKLNPDLDKQALYTAFLKGRQFEVLNPAAPVVPPAEARQLIDGIAQLATDLHDQQQLHQAAESQQAANSVLRSISTPRQDGRVTIAPTPPPSAGSESRSVAQAAATVLLGGASGDPTRINGPMLQVVIESVSAQAEEVPSSQPTAALEIAMPLAPQSLTDRSAQPQEQQSLPPAQETEPPRLAPVKPALFDEGPAVVPSEIQVGEARLHAERAQIMAREQDQVREATEMMEKLRLESAPSPLSGGALQPQSSDLAFEQATVQFKSETAGMSESQLHDLITRKYSAQRAHIQERCKAIQSENSGIEPVEALKIAIFVETVICKVQKVADRILHPEESGLSRRVIASKSGVYVLDLKRGERLGIGSSKTVKKAMRIFQNQRRNFEMVANLEMNITKKNILMARTEAEIFKRLQGQPGIIPFHIAQEWTDTVDAHSLPDSVTMICQLAEGSLTNRIEGLSAPERLQVAKDILTGVVSMHNLNIAHCDLKLDNVLAYSSQGRARAALTDFGLSVVVDASGKGEKRFPGQYGSISETAPELLTTSKSKVFTGDCKKCDSWATGCMLYKLFVGKNPPWDAVLGQVNIKNISKKSAQRQIAAMAPPEKTFQLPKNLPPQVQEAIRGLLHSDPKERYTAQRAQELLAQI